MIERVLREIDGCRYKAYRRLVGVKQVVDGVVVEVVRVQGDPYAPPSVVRLSARVSVPREFLENSVAFADWVYRRLFRELRRVSRRVGEGWSGFVGIPRPSPVMIRRSGAEVVGSEVVARVWVGLPSRRRRVLGDEAERILLRDLPRAFARAIDWRSDLASLERHVRAWVEQEFIRSRLLDMGLVAFVGDGSVLPRKHGFSDEPKEGAIPFESPPSLRVEIELPTGRVVSGMGIPKGFTVVMGPAFHGKTTLIRAIAEGVYNHVPGDGRELVVSIRDAAYVATEEGRFVTCVDASPFILDASTVGNPKCFTTRSASGATSVVASIQEAVEVGAKLLILDEDEVATNALYEDPLASSLWRSRSLAPLATLAKSMIGTGVSILVASAGSSQLLKACTTAILMDRYRPVDATSRAKELTQGIELINRVYEPPRHRVLTSVPALGRVRARGLSIEVSELGISIDLSRNPQIVEEGQVATIAEAIKQLRKYVGKKLVDTCREIEATIREKGFKQFLGREPGPNLSEVRALDIAYAINRLPIGIEAT